MNEKNVQKRIEGLLKTLNNNVYEKDEIIAVTLLGALAGLNTFLLGPPGTAKSLISRRIASVFKQSSPNSYFEFLMNKFSTPEELFGPIKLTELKNDNYVRKIEGYLPTANVAFLDEIWKANSAILNSLLTIINEKKFRNNEMIDVPLKVLISASNEVPPLGQGLEALYDRFLIRLFVSPAEIDENFNHIIQQVQAKSEVVIEEDKINEEELQDWQKKINAIKLSVDTIKVIKQIRLDIAKHNEKEKQVIYVSDRRWQRAARLLKASGFFNEREETNLVDTLLLRHCLWSNQKEREILNKIVTNAVRDNGVTTEISYQDLEDKKNKLDSDVQEVFYHIVKSYKSITLNNEIYYEVEIQTCDSNQQQQRRYTIYISAQMQGNGGRYHPVDAKGNSINNFDYNFNEQGSVLVRRRGNDYILDSNGNINDQLSLPLSTVDKIEITKGVKERLFDPFFDDVNELFEDLEKTKKEIEAQKASLEKNLYSLFVPKDTRNIASESINNQLERLNVIKLEIGKIEDAIKKAKNAQ